MGAIKPYHHGNNKADLPEFVATLSRNRLRCYFLRSAINTAHPAKPI
jgi:hypothetical protein